VSIFIASPRPPRGPFNLDKFLRKLALNALLIALTIEFLHGLYGYVQYILHH